MENLEEMVKGYPENFTNNTRDNQQTEDSELETKNIQTQPEEVVGEQVQQNDKFKTTNLAKWFPKNVPNFENIFSVNAKLRGVDPDKNLIVTVVDPIDESEETRHPYIFRDSDLISVLDLPGNDMFVYPNNTFQINYITDENLAVKTYSVKADIIVVFCYIEKTNNSFIPLYIGKYKSTEPEIEFPNLNFSSIEEKLKEDADLDTAIILYPQLKKFKDNIKTNFDLVKFFVERQSKIYDVNHLLQIDKAVSEVFKV